MITGPPPKFHGTRDILREMHEANYRFQFGQPDVLRHGAEIAVFSMGGMLEVLLDAVDELAERDIDPTVVNVSSLPVDTGALCRIAASHEAVFVIEDHHLTGGLADEIGRILLSMETPPRFKAWGVPDYGQAAAPSDLYTRYQLDRSAVVEHLASHLHRTSGRAGAPHV